MTLKDFGWCSGSSFDLAFGKTAASDREVARIVSEHRSTYQVQTESGELTANITGVFRHQNAQAVAYPAVGDWAIVEVAANRNAAQIHQVLPRRSQFVRQAAGSVTAGQVVAANVDTVFLVSGLDGDFNLRRLERYLVTAWDSGANPVVLLNKADLCSDLDAAIAQVESVAIGVPVHPVSAASGHGIDTLNQYLQPGQTVALIGSSGVGKSTLTNVLLGTAQQATQAVRADDSRGRHTTTHRQLIPLPSGALLIDTPGMRELQLWCTGEGLSETFQDIEQLAADCQFRDCAHALEPGCAVQAAIAAGTLDAKRLHSYQKLQREQQRIAQRRNRQASQNSKRRWQTITKTMRQRHQSRLR